VWFCFDGLYSAFAFVRRQKQNKGLFLNAAGCQTTGDGLGLTQSDLLIPSRSQRKGKDAENDQRVADERNRESGVARRIFWGKEAHKSNPRQ